MTSSGGQQITCSQCGREFPAAVWRAHAHSPDRARCVEPGCGQLAVGFAIRGMSPLCGMHLVERRSRGLEVRFVDGGICTVCLGHGQVASEHDPGGDWERCPLCRGSGYLDEEKLNEERGRAEEEQFVEYRRRSELRREIEEGAVRRRTDEQRLNEQRRAEIERATEYARRLAGMYPPSTAPSDGGGDDGSGGVEAAYDPGEGRPKRGRCRTILRCLVILTLVAGAATGGAAALFYFGFGGELPGATPTPTQPAPTEAPTPVPTATPTPTATAAPTPTATATATATPTPTPSPTPTPTAAPTPPPTAGPTPEQTATPTPEPVDVEALAALVGPSVVAVNTSGSSGSGVIVEVDDTGKALVVTNYQVIEDDFNIIQVVAEDGSLYDASLLGSDGTRDLAVLSVCCSDSFQAAELSGTRPAQGDDVFTLGYPLESGSAEITQVTVSDVSFQPSSNRWEIRTDALLDVGNSGGALFTTGGEVVGITTVVIRGSDVGTTTEGVGLAVASETVLSVLPTLKTGARVDDSEGMRDTVTDRPGSFGPVEGYLTHDDDEFIEEFGAGVSRGDFVASAEFHNPYPLVVGGWDYGFLFRDEGQHDFHAVVIENRDKQWFHYVRDGADERRLVGSGEASGLWPGSDGVNDVRLVVLGAQGWLFLNGGLIGELDLSAGPSEGNVSVITGYRDDNEIPGRQTRYREFTVHEPQQLGNRTGTLDHTEDGFIERSIVGGDPRDFVVTATFTNPNAASAGWWDYGFTFRGAGPDAYHGVYIDRDREWHHFLQTAGNRRQVSRTGRALNLNTRDGGQNTLMLVAVGQTGLFYVNGELVRDDLDLREGAPSGIVGIGSGFHEGGRLLGQQTHYQDFRVWSLDRPPDE